MTQKIRFSSLLDLALVMSFMALAGYLRFTGLDNAGFNFDEGYALELATDILENDPFTARGLPSSVGILNSSAFLYLLTIPLLFNSDPLWVTGFVALINTFAVGACYGIARRWFGLGPAIIATSLYALNPWAVIFSRKIWAQNGLSIFSVALLACLLLYQKGRRPWWGAFAIPVWAIGIQIHFSAAALLPVMAISLVTGINRRNVRQLIIGGLLFLISFTPMIFSETGESWNRLPTVLSEGSFDMTSWSLMQELVMGDGDKAFLGKEVASPIQRLINENSVVRFLTVRIMLVWTAAAVLYMFAFPIKRRRLDDCSWRRMVIGLASVSAPLLFMYHPGGQLHIYYLLTIWPASFIAVGILLNDLTTLVRNLGSRGRLALFGCWAVLMIWLFVLASVQLIDHAKFLRLSRQNEGMTVGRVNSIAEAVRSIQDSGEVYMVNLSRDLSTALRYALRQQHHVRGSVSRNSQAVVVNQQPTILILRSEDQPIAREIDSNMAGHMVRQFSFEGDTRRLLLYQVDYEDALELCQQNQVSALTFGGQVTLAGTHLHPTDGRDVVIVNCWHVHQRPADLPDQLSVFNHLVDGGGNKVTQADGLGHVPTQWRDGDIILNYYLLPIPSDIADGEYHLLTGLYRLDTGRRIPIAQRDHVAEQVQTGPYTFEKGRLQFHNP